MSVAVADVEHGDMSYNPKSEMEIAMEGLDKAALEERVQFLMETTVSLERELQRSDDQQRDHPIRFYSRQKDQPLCKILFTLFMFTLVYAAQYIALYNLNRDATKVSVATMTSWIESGLFVNRHFTSYDPIQLPTEVRRSVNSSTIDILQANALGYCLTDAGISEAFFNVASGLFMIYLFIFFDLWFVVFDLPLTRSFPGERHFALMIIGEVWMVFLNSGVLVWLSIIAGNSVLASCGDFEDVISASLQTFIILSVDDAILPAMRFLVEEHGHLNKYGNLDSKQLDVLTHGSQYYRPGYGHNWAQKLRSPRVLMKLIPVVMFPLIICIVFVPAAVVLTYSWHALVRC